MSRRAAGPHVLLERPSMRRAGEFLEAVESSRKLHSRWVRPPATVEQYWTYVQRMRKPAHRGHLVCTKDGPLAGVININEIVRGAFQSGYLGYYAFAPHAGGGYMWAGLVQVVQLAFRDYGLHRLEANIQPDNARSVSLVRSLGFWREGFSIRYLKVAGRWRDHERWAITREVWKARKTP